MANASICNNILVNFNPHKLNSSKKIFKSFDKKKTKKTATRDLQHLVKAGALIKKGRTGKGVHYILSSTYKGDKIVIEQSSDANLAIESGGKVVIRK